MAERPLRAYKGDESYIFVAYSHEDSDLVYPQIRWLQDQGFNIVWDEGVSPGAVWRKEIAEAIRHCSLLLFFTTPNSVDSEHCTREVNFALDDHHRPVLAVHLEETALPDALALSLSDRQAIMQYALDSENYERKLVSTVAGYLEQPVPAIASSLRTSSRKFSRQVSLTLAIVCSLLIGIVGTWFATRPGPAAARLQTRIPIELPEGEALPFGRSNFVSISLKGERIFFVGENAEGRRQVYIRRLDQLESQPLPGTEDSPEDQLLAAYPSPDGESIALAYKSGMVKKVSSSGGSLTLIAESPGSRAPSLHWGHENRIAFSYNNGASLAQAIPSGGELETLIASKEWLQVLYPHYTPDGQSLFFVRFNLEGFGVMAMALDKRVPKHLVADAFDPKVTSSGHLLFSRDNTVWAVALDASGREVVGAPVAVLQDVQAGSYLAGKYAMQYAVSANGTLVYQPSTQNRAINLIWVDRQGRKESVGTLAEILHDPDISPDQRSVAFTSGGNGELWTYSFDSGLATRQWKSDVVWNTSWSPDGTQIAFSDWQSGRPNIFVADLTDDEPVHRLTQSDLYQWTNGWSNDGEYLLLDECAGFMTSCDISLLPIDSPDKIKTIVGSAANETGAKLSPDNTHLAYISDASGFNRIVIQPFPISGRDRVEVQIDGCDGIVWSPKGDELFGFCNELIVAIPFHQDPALSVGHPEVLFSVDSYIVRDGARVGFFDVSADGERFLMVEEGVREGATGLVVVLNWLDEVERLVPTE